MNKYEKNIYEGRYGRKPFVDGLSANQAHKDNANKAIRALDKIFTVREIHYHDRPFNMDIVDQSYGIEMGK